MKHPAIWTAINLGDWYTATNGLSAEEKGAVIEMLLAYWDRGEWPSDQSMTGRLKISARRWMAMQGAVGDALNTYLDRSGFIEKRARAQEITEIRRGAANNRWDRYRKNATQGLDAKASFLHMRNQKPESSTYTDKAEKPAGANGLGEKTVGHRPGANSWPPSAKPNGKGRH